jgi:hypothetical protein
MARPQWIGHLVRWGPLAAAAAVLAAGIVVWQRDSHPAVLAVAPPPAAPGAPAAPAVAEAPPPAPPPLVAPSVPRPVVVSPDDAEKEARRFARLDTDRSSSISRDEYLASRRKSFDKLDTNGDGAVSYDEYSAKAAKKFAGADANGDGKLSASELATTAPKHRAKPVADAPPEPPEGQ